MKILILGKGAREKVIAEKLIQNEIFYINDNNHVIIVDFCIDNNINLVIPSTEDFLCTGIVDVLHSQIPNICVFGPTQFQAQIEGSKHFSKKLMCSLKIPTAPYLYSSNPDFLYTDFNSSIFGDLPVLKYSGLAKGKGVYLPSSKDDISNNIVELFKLGNDGIIIEKRLDGVEVSLLAFCNGKEAILMPQAQDYKREYDNNQGLNTGGMGAICPVNILNETEIATVKSHMDKIVQHLKYKGILYAGLMKTTDNVYFLEFNCRFGDPEAQVILNLLDDDLLNIMTNCIRGEKIQINWSNKKAAVVVLTHQDYPRKKLVEPVEIQYGDLDDTVCTYDSNITSKNNKSYTTGGRVLSMVSVDTTIQLALQNIYNNIHKISFPGAFYRRDIGLNNVIHVIPNRTYPLSIAILASGNGTCLEYLFNQNPEYIKLIITNKSTAGIAKKAYKYNIPFLYIPRNTTSKNEYYERIVNILRSYGIELVILAGYMNIVPSILFEEFNTINIHPSLLPKYGGLMDMTVHDMVLKNNEIFSGCTLHKVTKDVDKGRILLQKQYKIKKDDTAISLKRSIQDLEKQCIIDYINTYDSTNHKYEVDIVQGNEFIDSLKNFIPKLDGFCALYEHKGIKLAASADGCGTKLELANRCNKWDTIGIDLVAMNVNDLIAGGAVPLFFMDYIALDRMDKNKCKNIIKGVIEGCKLANCKLIGGETAEMHNIYLKNKYDLAGFVVGEVKFDLPKKLEMDESCILYGVKSSGIHSNGYTLVNKLLKNSFDSPSIKDLLEPTRIYTEISKLCSFDKQETNNILGIAHITGGGYHDNIVRILPDNLYFNLYNWKFPKIFQWIQSESNMLRSEMLNTFNCGYGMVIVCKQKYSANVENEFNLEVIGNLTCK